jgi:hypothetical protein
MTDFDVERQITALGTGEALITVLTAWRAHAAGRDRLGPPDSSWPRSTDTLRRPARGRAGKYARRSTERARAR